MIRPFLIRTFIAMLVVSSAALSGAQVLMRGSLSNFDYYNYTGITANDFEILLVGISPKQVAGIYRGYYPNATVTQTSGGTLIHWTGSKTPNGAFAHFGVNFTGVDMSVNPAKVVYTWTLDGIGIGQPLPGSWQYWTIDPKTGKPVRRDIIRNPSTQPIFVVRRVAISEQASMDLGELMRGGVLWNSAKQIDDRPVAIAPGGELTFDFEMPNLDAWAVMMYDIMDAKGRLIGTFLNATNDLPMSASSSKKSIKKAPSAYELDYSLTD